MKMISIIGIGLLLSMHICLAMEDPGSMHVRRSLTVTYEERIVPARSHDDQRRDNETSIEKAKRIFHKHMIESPTPKLAACLAAFSCFTFGNSLMWNNRKQWYSPMNMSSSCTIDKESGYYEGMSALSGLAAVGLCCSSCLEMCCECSDELC